MPGLMRETSFTSGGATPHQANRLGEILAYKETGSNARQYIAAYYTAPPCLCCCPPVV